MAFVDTPFPAKIAMGAQRFSVWKTTVVVTQGGAEFRNQERSRAQHRFDIGFAIRTKASYVAVQAHHHMMRGRLKSFPFKDALDFSASASEGVVIDYGESPTILQLAKRYGSGSDAYDREITRPKSGTLAIYRTRTGTTTNITTSTTVDYSGGRIEIAGGVYLAGDTLSWSGEFRVPCRYDVDELPAVTVNRQPGPDGELLVDCSSIMVLEDMADFVSP